MNIQPQEERVLIVAPLGEDAATIATMLEAEGIGAEVCDGSGQCVVAVAEGAGALLVTEEALELTDARLLLGVLEKQPAWSELPLLILTRGGETRLNSLLDLSAAAAGSIMLLERPMSAVTLLRSVQVALRARRRQYQVRDLLAEQAKNGEALESLVRERTAKLQELVGELEHFSYTITHDMRAPLRAMRGLIEVMRDDDADWTDQERGKVLQRIITAAERMDSLITDALSYSQAVRSELPIEPVDVGRLLEGMLETYPELQGPGVEITVEDELPLVMGNSAGLTQCFSNLLGNAVKFVKPGEPARVRIWAETRTAERGGLQRESWVKIWVEDAGIGISGSLLPRVFDMFSHGSNPQAGTGIGLALVRKMADRMGGRVGVESEPGQGSRFWLELRSGDVRLSPAGVT